VRIEPNTVLTELSADEAVLSCVFTGQKRSVTADQIVMVTSRESHDDLYRELEDRIDIARIGDCLAPGTIASCVRSGHEYAQEMDAPARPDVRFRREAAIRSDRP